MEKSSVHLTKKDIRGPDEFIKTSGVLLNFIEKHSRILGIALGSFVLLGLLYSGNEYWTDRKEEKASSEFFQVKKTREKFYQDFEKSLGDKQKIAEKRPEPPFSADIAQSYQSFLKAHGSTQAGVIAAIELGGYLSEHKKSKEAREALALIPHKSLKSGMLVSLFYTLMGRVEADLGNCQAAIENWEKPLMDQTQKAFHPDLLLRTALCYEKLDQRQKAVQNYDRIINDHAQSRAAESAKVYKRLLERQKT